MKAALAASAALLASACVTPGGPQASADAALDALAERRVALQVSYNPASAYNLGVPAPDHRRWPDRSQAAIAAFQRQSDSILADLRRIDPARLTTPQRRSIHAAMLEWLEAERQARICRFDLWAVNHMGGWHLNMLSNVARDQPVGTPGERSDAIARWSALPAFIDREIANARLGLAQGYSAPKAVVRRVIRQIDGIVSARPETLPFFAPATRAEDPAFRESFRSVLAGPVNAAFRRYRDFLRDEYLPRAREALGVSANPNGVQCYSASLRSYTTLPRPPEEVFRLGQQTVAANSARVRELGRAHFGTDDLAVIVPRIAKAPDNLFSSEQELIEYSREVVARARELSRPLFASMPAQEMRVEPFDAFRRGSGGSSYYQNQIDPALPAFYRINSETWQTETRGGAEIVAVHEGYPGHHMQISLANMIGTSPITKLTGNSAYVEGWARYSEALAEEAGIYRTPYAPMTRRLWPARGMVVDPGLHVMGWSRQQVIDFIRQSGRFSGPEADDLVDRVAIWPGQLTAYDSGGLEIMALRREAEAALGPRFDIRRFHQRVLESGAIPLTALRANIAAWIAAERRSR
ncbi:MAG TPA: DUF885 domain-containing protein [Allosphingosinicella sp.]|nr:DUF885 domain-containing protein [Allosphingosinicella sp.]